MICKKCGREYADDMFNCLWCDAPNEHHVPPEVPETVDISEVLDVQQHVDDIILSRIPEEHRELDEEGEAKVAKHPAGNFMWCAAILGAGAYAIFLDGSIHHEKARTGLQCRRLREMLKGGNALCRTGNDSLVHSRAIYKVTLFGLLCKVALFGLLFFGRRWDRIKAVQYADNNRIDNSANQATGKVGHEVEHAAFATIHETLVEFIRATVCKREYAHNKYAQPLPLGPLGAGPEHGVATGKSRVFAEMRQFVPDLREIFQLLVRERRYLEDYRHAENSGNGTEKRVLVKKAFKHLDAKYKKNAPPKLPFFYICMHESDYPEGRTREVRIALPPVDF